MCGGGGNASKEIERQQLQRQQAIQSGMAGIDSVFSGFDGGYFEGVRKNALAQLMPQFNRQAATAQKGLAFGMADKGLLNSSAARQANTELQVQKGIGATAVQNQAQDVVRATQQQVAGERSTAVNQLVASQDPALAAQQAVAGAANIQAPSIAQPLGNMFKTFADTYYARGVGQTFNSPQGVKVGGVGGGQGRNYYVK